MYAHSRRPSTCSTSQWVTMVPWARMVSPSRRKEWTERWGEDRDRLAGNISSHFVRSCEIVSGKEILFSFQKFRNLQFGYISSDRSLPTIIAVSYCYWLIDLVDKECNKLKFGKYLHPIVLFSDMILLPDYRLSFCSPHMIHPLTSDKPFCARQSSENSRPLCFQTSLVSMGSLQSDEVDDSAKDKLFL